jgi:hypothetical protein
MEMQAMGKQPKMAKNKQQQTDKGKELIEAAYRGIQFVTNEAQIYPSPPIDKMFVLEQIVKYAHDFNNVDKEQGLPLLAAMATRAAWQYGRTGKEPDIRVETDTVPMLLGTIENIPDSDIDHVRDVSAFLFATLRSQAIHGEEVNRRNSVRLTIWVMYTYGRRSAEKEAEYEHVP